jgi:hypothetical protein
MHLKLAFTIDGAIASPAESLARLPCQPNILADHLRQTRQTEAVVITEPEALTILSNPE